MPSSYSPWTIGLEFSRIPCRQAQRAKEDGEAAVWKLSCRFLERRGFPRRPEPQPPTQSFGAPRPPTQSFGASRVAPLHEAGYCLSLSGFVIVAVIVDQFRRVLLAANEAGYGNPAHGSDGWSDAWRAMRSKDRSGRDASNIYQGSGKAAGGTADRRLTEDRRPKIYHPLRWRHGDTEGGGRVGRRFSLSARHPVLREFDTGLRLSG